MKKILVLGCPGSGKSTLSRRLGPLLDIPVVHMDRLFWTPGWVSIPRDALIRKSPSGRMGFYYFCNMA